MKKPVYSLVAGDVFIARDGQAWAVDHVEKPEGWSNLPQIGEKPKAWMVHAWRNGTKRAFAYHNGELVNLKEME